MALQALHGVDYHSKKANGLEEDENVYLGNMTNQCQLYMPPLSKVSLENRDRVLCYIYIFLILFSADVMASVCFYFCID